MHTCICMYTRVKISSRFRKKVEIAIFTSFGKAMAEKYHMLVYLDSTHKTIIYDYNLFTLVTQDKHQQGIPIAYLKLPALRRRHSSNTSISVANAEVAGQMGAGDLGAFDVATGDWAGFMNAFFKKSERDWTGAMTGVCTPEAL